VAGKREETTVSLKLQKENDNIMDYLLFKPHTAKSRPEAEPITVDFFVVFALLFGYCVAI